MKNLCLFSLTLIFAGWMIQSEAAVVLLGGPGVVISSQQPIQAIVVDSNGNTFEQTVCYNPAIGGVDLNTAWAGPNASVYFPAYNTGYIWNNGFWVDQSGYYFDGGRRVFVSQPNWGVHWNGYWQGHGHGGWYHSNNNVSVNVNKSVHVHESVHNNYYQHGHGGHDGHHHHH